MVNWSDFSKNRKKLLKKAEDAVLYLESLNKPITRQAICNIVGVSRPNLREYLEGTTLLKKIVEEDYYDDGTRKLHWHEKELVELVKAKIQEMCSLGELITRRRIADKIGMSQQGLYRYASVRALVKEYTRPSLRGLSETELVTQVKAAIRTLTLQGKPIGYQSVSLVIGVSKQILYGSLLVRKV